MWSELLRRYAARAREFSDAVAALVQNDRLGPEASRQLLSTIKTRLESCNAVADEIDRYVSEKAEAAKGT
jgi:hypothetical protein